MVLHTRELDESAYATKQMTTAKTVGAVSNEAAEWYAIDWPTIHRNVRRLQVRIVQATKESRWGKVKSLQRLLTHSYSGKVLAVRRVTENNGKKTPGVDQKIWKTPEDKIRAVHALKSRGYQSQPLRRVYIPKSDGKTMRPLGIPCMIDRAHQALHLLALDPVLETNADRNSYGFRQKRSCADAIGGIRRSPRPGSERNTMSAVGDTTGVSSGNATMTRDSLARCGCTAQRAPPLKDTLKCKAKPTLTILPTKPISKIGKALICWTRSGVPRLFAFSGRSNAVSALFAISKSLGSRAGACTTASLL